MDLRLECGACGAIAELDAESLSDTHRPACLRCGGRLRRVDGGEDDDVRADVGGGRPEVTSVPPRVRAKPTHEDPEPFDADGFLWRARRRELAGDLAGALSDCDAALELEPDLAPVWLLRGAARARQGDAAAAARDLERFLALAPDHPQAARARAKLAELRGG